MSVCLAIVGILSGVAFELILTAEGAEHLFYESIQSRQAIFDRVDPRTGVSECLNKAAFCTHPLYRKVMWEQCPFTCYRLGTQNRGGVVDPIVPVPGNPLIDPIISVNSVAVNPVKALVPVGNVISAHPMLINPPTASPDCFDHVNPKTGVSDCVGRKALCNDNVYQQLMWEQCPRTCGKCPDNLPNSDVRPGNPISVNPAPTLNLLPVSVPVPFVQQPVVKPNLMPVVSSVSATTTPSVRPVPATLLPASSSNPTTPASQALLAVRPPSLVESNCCDYIDPRTGKSDCARLVQFCRHPNYIQIMREQCQKTCRFCV